MIATPIAYDHGCVLIGQLRLTNELTNENAAVIVGNRQPRSLPTFIYDHEFVIRVLVLCFTNVTCLLYTSDAADE